MTVLTRKDRKELSDDFVEGTTLHGVADACRAENCCFRALWIFAIVAAAAGAAYEIGMVVKDYVGSPLITVYERKAEVELPFPIIQICPSHFVNRTKVYVDHQLHPSVVDEYLSYFASPAEGPVTNYTQAEVGKAPFDRQFDRLPLAYLVVSSATKPAAVAKIRAVLQDDPMFAAYAVGERLEQMYKYGFYKAQDRQEEAVCYRAQLTDDPGMDCGEHKHAKLRRKRSAGLEANGEARKGPRLVDQADEYAKYDALPSHIIEPVPQRYSEAGDLEQERGRRRKRAAGSTGASVEAAAKGAKAGDFPNYYTDMEAAANNESLDGSEGALLVAKAIDGILDHWKDKDLMIAKDQVLDNLVDMAASLVGDDDAKMGSETVNGSRPIVFMLDAVNNPDPALKLGIGFIQPATSFVEFLVLLGHSGAVEAGPDAAEVAGAVQAAFDADPNISEDALVAAAEAKWEEIQARTTAAPTTTPAPTTPAPAASTSDCPDCTTTTTTSTTTSTTTTTTTTTTTLPSTGVAQFDEYLYEPVPDNADHEAFVSTLQPYEAKTAEFVERVGMETAEVLVGCNWRSSYVACDQLARPTFDARLGQCFTLDRTQAEKRTQIAEGSGLVVVVELKEEFQWTYRPEVAAGASVRIMDSYEPITVGDLWAPVGTVTKIDLRSTNYQFHTDPKYEACHQDIPREILKAPYSDSLCRSECLMREELRQCQCVELVPEEFLINANISQCREHAGRQCLKDLMAGEAWVDQVRSCFEQCRPACSYWEHVPIVTYSAFPSKVYKDYVAHTDAALAERLSNFLLLDISYARLQYTQIRQELSITVDGFLSQIGGHLGLFLGSSVLSLFQLLVFAANTCCCANHGHRRR